MTSASTFSEISARVHQKIAYFHEIITYFNEIIAPLGPTLKRSIWRGLETESAITRHIIKLLFFPREYFYIVRYWLQPYGGPINSGYSRCRDLGSDFGNFEGIFRWNNNPFWPHPEKVDLTRFGNGKCDNSDLMNSLKNLIENFLYSKVLSTTLWGSHKFGIQSMSRSGVRFWKFWGSISMK